MDLKQKNMATELIDYTELRQKQFGEVKTLIILQIPAQLFRELLILEDYFMFAYVNR